MEKSVIKAGNWIEVDYTGSFDDGKVFDSSENREPLKFKAGSGMVIPGFDKAVIGLKEGDSKTVKIPAKEAYGEKNSEKTQLPKDIFGDLSLIKKGQEVELMSNQGPILLNVIDITEKDVVAILNHPMAGKNLNFKISVKKIYSDNEGKALEEEMMQNADSCCGNEDCENCECEDDDKGHKEHKHHKH